MKHLVTAIDAQGKSYFVEGEKSLRSIPFGDGGGFEEIWMVQQGALLEDACDSLLKSANYFPEPGEVLFRVATLMPGYLERAAESKSETDEAAEGAGLEQDMPGMHTTATLDFIIVLGGCVDLELDNGVTRRMIQGDSVVQRATRHRWVPVGEEPVVLATIMLGTKID